MKRVLAGALIAVIAGVAVLAQADGAPGTVAFSARITKDGVPHTDSISLKLSLFRSSDRATDTTPIWTETQTPTPAGGMLALQLGEFEPLTPDLLDGRALYLEIMVNDGTETVLEPRLQIGSVPYALRAATAARADYASETGAVPAGAVMHFDLAACPPGWAELPQARGRTIVGGTPGEPVGAALADREDRAHTHGIRAHTVSSRDAGDHSHGTPSTGASEVPHTHGVATTFRSQGEGHSHTWAQFSANQWGTWGFGGEMRWLDARGFRTANSDVGFPLWSPASIDAFYTSPNTHSHEIRLQTTTAGADRTSHTHSISLPRDGSHQHVVDVAATNTLPVTTSQVMPYVQLLVCRKMGPA